jgi:hypothetical protein
LLAVSSGSHLAAALARRVIEKNIYAGHLAAGLDRRAIKEE